MHHTTRTRTRFVLHRAIRLILVTTLALTLDAGAAVADSAPPGQLEPNGNYSVNLNARIKAVNERIESLPQREAAVDARQTALDGRVSSYNEQSRGVLSRLDTNSQKISAHNAEVSRYPNGAPPAVADALNAQANALNAEREQLKTEANTIADEGGAIKSEQGRLKEQKDGLEKQRGALVSERQQLLQEIATVLLTLSRAPPTTVQQAPGGDAARPPGSTGRGEHAPSDGGDPASRKTQGSALDDYARKHGVEVDKRQVSAILSPDAVTKLSANEAAQLHVLRAFDGLVRKPNGNYKALHLVPPGQQPNAAQNAFDQAIARGGQATDVVDGQTVTIDEVEQVAAPAPQSGGIDEAHRKLRDLAKRACAETPRGPGQSASSWGKRVHRTLEELIRQSGDATLFGETGYLNGQRVDMVGSRWPDGTSAPDAGFGSQGQPQALFDLKTGKKGIQTKWLKDLKNNLAGLVTASVPVFQLNC